MKHFAPIMRNKISTSHRLFMHTFRRYAITTLLPLMLLSVAIILIINHNEREQAEKYTQSVLQQSMNTLDAMFEEIRTMNITFSANQDIYQNLKRIFETPYSLDYDRYKGREILLSLLNTPVDYREHIQSIYIYLNGFDLFLSSDKGVTPLDEAQDIEWYNSYVNKGFASSFAETRIMSGVNERVLTIYQPMFSIGSGSLRGVVVVNLNADYIERLLDEAPVFPGQKIFLYLKSGKILLGDETFLSGLSPDDLFLPEKKRSVWETDGQRYLFSTVESKNQNIRVVSLTPFSEIYRLPLKITIILISIALLAAISGIALAWSFTSRNTHQFNMILDIVDAAENKRPFPELKTNSDSDFMFITQNVLRAFVENSYMKLQLKEKDYQCRIMSLTAAQAQMNPHFLFNTLDTINWKIIKAIGGYSAANEMIADLSALLQYSLGDPVKRVLLCEEVLITQKYIHIMQERSKNKFTVYWNVDPMLDEIQIIRLILQPLIENSIYHGFRQLEKPGLLRVRVYLKEERIVFTITDNGKGISRDKLLNIRDALASMSFASDSIGLFNTAYRLRLVYGDVASLHISSVQNIGTKITFSIPISGEKFDL